MAEFPALPLWTDAYLADTTHLSHAEHGRYLLMLIHLWRTPHKKFPNDDAWLARKFCCCEDDIRELYRPLIYEFFRSSGNWLYQKRILREYERVQATSKRASDRRKCRETNSSGGNSTCSTDEFSVVSDKKAHAKSQNTQSRGPKNGLATNDSDNHSNGGDIHSSLKSMIDDINSACTTAPVQQPEPYPKREESKLSVGDTDSLAENGKNIGDTQPERKGFTFSDSEAKIGAELTAQANGGGTVEFNVRELLGSLGKPGPLRNDNEVDIQSDWQQAFVRYGLPETPRKPSWQRNGDGTFSRVRP